MQLCAIVKQKIKQHDTYLSNYRNDLRQLRSQSKKCFTHIARCNQCRSYKNLTTISMDKHIALSELQKAIGQKATTLFQQNITASEAG